MSGAAADRGLLPGAPPPRSVTAAAELFVLCDSLTDALAATESSEAPPKTGTERDRHEVSDA
ncbi:hypothetical protein GFY24_32940 [Nocardia sp. SYP-A9097]|uniref:hypothetical protein n=1 Tax=Nocardia sp. SYP-A9097 TaxID=2663237 RepID=UPI00129AAC10|nr:hypothetical protein [Nocardia sp. SYP-A9097]MRH92186.1 hypothetical protein [Nocardia sp. SYP-A9097]